MPTSRRKEPFLFEDRLTSHEKDAYQRKFMDAKHAMAEAFAMTRGWSRKEPQARSFGWKALAGVPGHRKDTLKELPPYCDHTWWFFKDKRPAGLVTFPYHCEWDEMDQFALDTGLDYDRIVDDLPNWYGYGTHMIVWYRRE